MSTLVERLRAVGRERYHDRHPFHVAMHAGELDAEQLRGWVLNRFYYQTIIPIKDALILSKTEELGVAEGRAFRQMWIRRIHDHDDDGGGLEQWEHLAGGMGIDTAELVGLGRVEPAARAACDGYVAFVRERTLLEAVASSLTEFFAPDIMRTRIAAWEKHYPWISPAHLEYFRSRPQKATRDSGEALAFVLHHATTADQRDLCVAALERKCAILSALLDAIAGAYPLRARTA